MKKIAALALISVIILSGCGIIPKIITSSDGQAPTPVENVIDPPAPTETAAPTDTAVPEPTATTPAQPEVISQPLAYVALDGNLKLRDLTKGTDQAVTNDATVMTDGKDPQINYSDPTWSSDGQYLAYQRLIAKKIDSGLQYTFSLWVYDMTSGTAKEVVADTQTAGFAFRPGSHTLTYGQVTDPNYFTARAEVDSTKAKGIWAVDAASGGAPYELVPPAGGYSLVQPVWSENGKLVAFDEILYMEGRGYLAYYNMDTAQYTRRDQQVGSYDLFADGSKLVYDMMTYMPNGTERIWLANLDGSGAVRISPDYTEGYAYGPKLSPDEKQVAYWKGTGAAGEPTDSYELFVQPVAATSEPTSYGTVSTPVSLDWMPDGQHLILCVGDYDHREIVSLTLGDPTFTKLVDGNYPALRP